MSVLLFIINLLLSYLLARASKDKKIGETGMFFISFFFSPLIGIIVFLISPKANLVVVMTKKGLLNYPKKFLDKNVYFVEEDKFTNEFYLRKNGFIDEELFKTKKEAINALKNKYKE